MNGTGGGGKPPPLNEPRDRSSRCPWPRARGAVVAGRGDMRAPWLSVVLAACGGSSHSKPDAPPDIGPATKIAITSDTPLLLAVFRDGVGAPWQTATMIS